MSKKSDCWIFYVYVYEFYENDTWIVRYIGRGCNNRIIEHLTAEDFLPFHVKLREHLSSGGQERHHKVAIGLSLASACLIEQSLIEKYGRVCKNSGTLYNQQPGGIQRAASNTREAQCKLCEEAILIVQDGYRESGIPVGSDDFSVDARYHPGIEAAIERVYSDLVGDFGYSTYRNNISTTMRDWVALRKSGRRPNPALFSKMTTKEKKQLDQLQINE